MTIELPKKPMLCDDKVAMLGAARNAGSSCSLRTGGKNIELSDNSTEGSVMKRCVSQTSVSSTESSENDSDSASKPFHTTKSFDNTVDDTVSNDIRADFSKTESELFATLPDPNDEKMSPDQFLHKLVYATCGLELEPKKARTFENFFAKVTEEQIAAYTTTVVSACRSNDLDALKKLHTEDGQILNAFNRFGESLLTMACRRGFEDIVEYLLESPGVDIRIADDGGRTVLHDACWNPSPQLKICDWIMKRDPSLFFIADNRGCTPFQYARPEHWGTWRQFLIDRKDYLQALTDKEITAKLSKA